MILYKKNNQKDTDCLMGNHHFSLKAVVLFSIFPIIFLIMCFFLYYSSQTYNKNNYYQQEGICLIHSTELFDKYFTFMELYSQELVQSNELRMLSNMTWQDAQSAVISHQLTEKLAIDMDSQAFYPINNVFCYLSVSDSILSPDGLLSSEEYYRCLNPDSMGNYESWLKALTTSSNNNTFITIDSVKPLSNQQQYLYCIALNGLHATDTQVIVCFLIDSEKLFSIFDNISSEGYNATNILFVTADNGQVILNHSPYTFEYITDIIASDYEDFYTTCDNTAFLRYTSPQTNYTYYYGIMPFEDTTSMATPKAPYIIVFILGSIIYFIMIYILTKRNIQIVNKLSQELVQATLDQKSLRDIVESQRPIICNSYVRQLLTGSVTTDEELSYIKEYLNLTANDLRFNGLYICVYNNTNDLQDYSTKNFQSTEDFNAIVKDAFEEFLGLPLYYFSPSDRTYAVLLVCHKDDEKNFIVQTNEVIVKLHNYLLDTYGIWLFAGIGMNTDNLMNVWESYQQATESISYTSKNYFFLPYEFIKKDSSVFYYPSELSTKLIHFITTGNTAQTLELFNLIHRENIEERSLPIHILKFLLSDIRNTLLKARFALPSSTSADIIKQIDELLNQHVTFKLCEDIALKLCALFVTKNEDTNLISTIEKYIEKNYADPSMGLNKISDEFQISESYFSHMFKEKLGVNFSTYLENIRMREATRLIKETDISLNELYISVGYNNATSFRRAFKKTYGVTPSSMREQK